MSEENTSSNSSTYTSSTAASPSDTRSQPRRFEPITHDQGDDDGDEDNTRVPGTIRRKRPPAISTSGGSNYGMISCRT